MFKVRFVDMSNRKDEGTVFFALLPTINIVYQNKKYYLYVAWLQYLIVLEK